MQITIVPMVSARRIGSSTTPGRVGRMFEPLDRPMECTVCEVLGGLRAEQFVGRRELMAGDEVFGERKQSTGVVERPALPRPDPGNRVPVDSQGVAAGSPAVAASSPQRVSSKLELLSARSRSDVTVRNAVSASSAAG